MPSCWDTSRKLIPHLDRGSSCSLHPGYSSVPSGVRRAGANYACGRREASLRSIARFVTFAIAGMIVWLVIATIYPAVAVCVAILLTVLGDVLRGLHRRGWFNDTILEIKINVRGTMAKQSLLRMWGRNFREIATSPIFILRIGIGISTAILANLLAKDAPTIYSQISTLAGPRLLQTGIGTLVIGLGLLAYLFKQWNQLWYGVTEVAVGCGFGFSIALTMHPETSSLSQWSSLVGLSYVIARGCNNMKDAYVRGPRT